jgi:acyl carrier protein
LSNAADIHAFVVETLLPGRGGDPVGYDDDLLALGVIDSFGIVELVGFLEERFGIAIEDDDLTPEHFSSVAGIAEFVSSKAPTTHGGER